MTACDRYHKYFYYGLNDHTHITTNDCVEPQSYEERTRQLRRQLDTVIINHIFFNAETPKKCANVVTISDSCVFRPVLNRQSQSRPLWASIGSLQLNRVARRFACGSQRSTSPRPLLAVLICIGLSSAPSGVALQRRALPTQLAAPATEPAVAPVQTEQSIRFWTYAAFAQPCCARSAVTRTA